jgi:hypothetical protein
MVSVFCLSFIGICISCCFLYYFCYIFSPWNGCHWVGSCWTVKIIKSCINSNKVICVSDIPVNGLLAHEAKCD